MEKVKIDKISVIHYSLKEGTNPIKILHVAEYCQESMYFLIQEIDSTSNELWKEDGDVRIIIIPQYKGTILTEYIYYTNTMTYLDINLFADTFEWDVNNSSVRVYGYSLSGSRPDDIETSSSLEITKAEARIEAITSNASMTIWSCEPLGTYTPTNDAVWKDAE